jgi:NTE family protein
VSDSRSTPTIAALRRLFERALHDGDAVSFSLPGGAFLFRAGEPADQLYWLRAGRLAVLNRPLRGEPRSLGVVIAGEPVGEMAMLAEATHLADVVALRDCEVLALSRSFFFAAAAREPGLLTELARLMVARARQTAAGVVASEPSVFGFMAVSEGVRVRIMVDRIAVAIRALGYSVAVIGAEAKSAPTEWFSNVAHIHDFVLYVGEAGETPWRTLVGRQVDRLFRVARGDGKPPGAGAPISADALETHALVDLILLQSPTCAAPRGSAPWSAALAPARLFQAREGDSADIQRLARVVTGQAVGLVLSGGAARAFAHIGAVRVLQARDVPIDFIGGVSMGAVIGLGLAMGWPMEELERRIRKAFVDSSPLADIAFPLVALSQGRRVRERLAEHFGDRQICDLWLPFFCVSTNLTTGRYQLHQHGLAREAVRASLSLPGVLPPVVDGANVLVDGAVMNNFPADIMRAFQPGPIIGVDVGRARSVDPGDLANPVTFWRWLLSGAWRQGPPIVSLLMRAATVTTGRDLVAARAATDVLILPMVDHVEIRDWGSYGPAVAAGEQAARRALDALSGAVTDIRRRAPLEEPVVAPD